MADNWRKVRARLDQEFNDIFEQMDTIVGKAQTGAEELLPEAEILPDEDETAGELDCDFDQTAKLVSPLAAWEDAEPPELDLTASQEDSEDFLETSTLNNKSLLASEAQEDTGMRKAPEVSPAAKVSKLSAVRNTQEPLAASNILALSPAELSSLIANAVEKGVLAALKKSGSQ